MIYYSYSQSFNVYGASLITKALTSYYVYLMNKESDLTNDEINASLEYHLVIPLIANCMNHKWTNNGGFKRAVNGPRKLLNITRHNEVFSE